MRFFKFFTVATIGFLFLVATSSFRMQTNIGSRSSNQFITAQTPVSLNLLGDGTFTASGGLNLSGTYTMDVKLKGQSRASAIRCLVVLTPNDNSGTITMKMDCQFATSTGQWQILSGTGHYSNLKGNGSLDMIGDAELLEGNIM